MSKQIKSTEIAATNEELKEILASDGKAAPVKKQSKHVMSRIFALLFAAFPIVACFMLGLCIVYLGTDGYVVSNEQNFLNVILAAFGLKGNMADLYAGITGAATTAPADKLFGILPLFAGSEMIGKISSLFVYAVAVVMVLSVIFALIALFSGKAAPALARTIAGMNAVTYFVYGAWLFILGGLDKPMIDIIAFAIAETSFLVYFIYSAIRAKKHIFLGTLILIFTTIATATIAFVYLQLNEHIQELINAGGTTGTIAYFVTIGILAFTAISYLIALHSLAVKKVYGADIVRTVILLLIGAFFVCVALMYEKYFGVIIFGGVIAASALLQLIIQSLAVCANRKKAKKMQAAAETVEEQPVQQPVEVEDDGAILIVEEPVEEEMEDVPVYEFAPVSPAVAQEPAPAPVSPVTADYDYYNTKSFDPFIASLSSSERAQFTELFILKYKGEMANIPNYQVGGDNREFFRKIFINLGSIRARLSDELLDKLYQFAIRL